MSNKQIGNRNVSVQAGCVPRPMVYGGRFHVAPDRTVTNLDTGKQVDPNDFGIRINGDMVEYQGSMIVGGGSITVNDMQITADSAGAAYLGQQHDPPSANSFVVVNGGSIVMDNTQTPTTPITPAKTMTHPKTAISAGELSTDDAPTDEISTLIECVHLHSRSELVLKYADHVTNMEPEQMCQLISKCYLHDIAKTYIKLIETYPDRFNSRRWKSNHWSTALRSCHLHDRIHLFTSAVHTIDASQRSLGYSHIQELYLHDRTKAATALLEHATAVSRMASETATATTTTAKSAGAKSAATTTTATTAAKLAVFDSDSELKRSIQLSLGAAAKPTNDSKTTTMTMTASKVVPDSSIPTVLNPSSIKECSKAQNDDDVCVSCLTSKKQVVSIICGHTSICIACMRSSFCKTDTVCPICQKKVTQWLVSA